MTPWAALELSRQPYDADPSLQAWSAADLLLARFALDEAPRPGVLHVVYNDAFGALSTLLVQQGRSVVHVSDSCLSQRCALWNLDANGLESERLFLLDSLTIPTGTPQANQSPVVLFRIPKSLALLEFQLHQIRGMLPLGTLLVSTGMTKDIHTSTVELYDQILGTTTTGLAEQKARMVRTVVEERVVPPPHFPTEYHVPGLNLTLVNHASVFSQGELDEGTRLFLEHFPKLPRGPCSIVDLGCGNGILALAAARRAPEAQIFCVDESFMAVWSARESFRRNELGGRGTFLSGDGLEDFDPESIDVVLCNPPFHFQNAQTLEIAKSFFNQAKKVLRKSGEFWLVGNRHLGYHKILEPYFGSVAVAALTEKFVVLRARQP